MCVFCNELPKHNNVEVTKKQNIYLSIKPSAPKEFYRFRLLWFKQTSKNDRDYPFIERFIHNKWTKNSEGKNVLESSVVCPVTPFVKAKWGDDPYTSCPICNYANLNFITYKESGYKDKTSLKKSKEYGRIFEACIPVYVVNDPNYPQNNGKLKVLIFNDKKEVYQPFKDLVNAKSREVSVFNGKNAVDFYIRMERRTEILNKGEPNEREWSHNVIAQMGFTKTEKAYDLPAITKELIDGFAFDDEYYVSSTPEELRQFYERYCKISNDDIPDETISVFDATPSTKIDTTNTITSSLKTENPIPEDDISVESDSSTVDDIDAESDSDFTESLDSAKEPDTANSKPSDSSDTTMDEIDALLNGI